jgi:hypothetical protein
VQLFSKNRSDGKLGILMTGTASHKFSIQKGDHVQSHVEFSQDMESAEVMTSLYLTLLDCLVQRDEHGGMDDAYRMISEMIEDFGSDRATLALVITDNLEYTKPETGSFLRAIAEQEQFRMSFLGLGRLVEESPENRMPSGMKPRVEFFGEFSVQDLDDFVLSSIEELTPDRSRI